MFDERWLRVNGFVHLHLHTEYSIGDSIVRIDPLIETAKSFDMKAIAITDHGTLGGVQKFWSLAKKAGIKPIIGCEIYVNGEGKKKNHLTVLAKNIKGYFSLVKAMNLVWKNGSRTFSEENVFSLEDVIVLSGCMSGQIPRMILSGDLQNAQSLIEKYKSKFGNDFYIELMDTGLKEQKELNRILIDLAKKFKIKTVATNDVHFLKKEDAPAHGLFVSIGRNMRWDGGFAYGSDEYYFKSSDEMGKIFKDSAESVENTIEIASKCGEYDINPALNLPNISEDDCKTLKNEIKLDTLKDDKRKRAEKELGIIESKKFCGYFLLVSNIVKTAEKNGILVGPGRGSAVSSLISYLLGITLIDPMKYDLLFERFLNESRVGDPDIDIDIEDDERDNLIRKLSQKYGEDHLAQVGAYGTLGNRAVVRAIGKAFGSNERVVEDLAWRVSGYESVSDAIKKNQDLKRMYKDQEIKKVIDYSLKLEGLIHHKTTHAAGIVISKDDLKEKIPMIFDNGRWITEFDMDALGELRVIKIDLLGLKTLTNLKDVLGKKTTRGSLMALPIEDPQIYTLLKGGDTIGIFQLESTSATALTKKLAPEKFDDVVALLSLNRPGPMYSGIADEYVKRRHGSSSMKDEFGLDEILKDTYGMMIYQEQIMKIATDIANFSGERADLFRKAVSKKDSNLMGDLKEEFVKGCVSNGYKEEKALRLFEMINQFASYGFNKSHSVAYAYITVWTAYLKATRTADFIASLMNSNLSDMTKLSMYAREAKKSSINVFSPDVNESNTLFTANGNVIRTGFAAIKGLGLNFGEIIEEERKKGKFENLEDFLLRMKKTKVNKKIVEALIFSGAFDSILSNRKYAIDNLDMMMDKANGGLKMIQQQLFENGKRITLPSVENYPDYDLTEKMKLQKEYLNIISDAGSGGFTKIMEKGHGRVIFYLFENNGEIFTTDGESEIQISYTDPLEMGGPYDGEFTYKSNTMILSKLLKSPNQIFLYPKDAGEIEKYISGFTDAPGKSIVIKLANFSIVIDDKTLKWEAP